MGQSADLTSATLQIFNHHLYELSKGMRPLALMTMAVDAAAPVIARLQGRGIAHYVHEACPDRVNVVFGSRLAVKVIQHFVRGPLCELSAEHDFMLGILFGYDREMQCERYLGRCGDAVDTETGLEVTSAPPLAIATDHKALVL
ncbi:MAG: DUF2023 family protein [Rhodopseudomonas palustris]|uniref:DUF2023 family protein n=1 Tax=Rhodopseudomonas palustris TaxID=1076 RepID=A0A933RZZ7_RHOPL|nr:DUF2023 family protein [Rhodopseudomonas palustris]